MTLPTVVMAMPHRGLIHQAAAEAFYARPTNGLVGIEALTYSSSILEACFNHLWCEGKNARKRLAPKYFAMLHDDVCPEWFWLDKLIAELEEHDADIVSAVVPIKDTKGLTSTALSYSDDIWHAGLRRLSLTEVHSLPKTFSRYDIDWPNCGDALLVNTGCWVCRFDRPWVDELCFRTESRNHNQNGHWSTQVLPEDWLFSIDAKNLGLKVMATTAVSLYHGQDYFVNNRPWGAWKQDEVWAANQKVIQPIAV